MTNNVTFKLATRDSLANLFLDLKICVEFCVCVRSLTAIKMLVQRKFASLCAYYNCIVWKNLNLIQNFMYNLFLVWFETTYTNGKFGNKIALNVWVVCFNEKLNSGHKQTKKKEETTLETFMVILFILELNSLTALCWKWDYSRLVALGHWCVWCILSGRKLEKNSF